MFLNASDYVTLPWGQITPVFSSCLGHNLSMPTRPGPGEEAGIRLLNL